ncbi:MAG: carcinine hydrolase/isopenicillin-N N-acyltransferase family protein [Actinomycetota bacterium]|nr:carcinine hydrolase/isopenicillin-N N-acyltransferase family protein [Actinomycetota bacterium]
MRFVGPARLADCHVGLAADESGSADADTTRSTVSALRTMRLVLDNAATVEEAIGVLEQYNLDFTRAPALQYLIADAGGASAVVEFVDGEMVVIRAATSWQALTNFRQANASANEFQNAPDGRRQRTRSSPPVAPSTRRRRSASSKPCTRGTPSGRSFTTSRRAMGTS